MSFSEGNAASFPHDLSRIFRCVFFLLLIVIQVVRGLAGLWVDCLRVESRSLNGRCRNSTFSSLSLSLSLSVCVCVCVYIYI